MPARVAGSTPVTSAEPDLWCITFYEVNMPYKDREKQLEFQRNHYKSNRKIYYTRSSKRKRDRQVWFQNLKKNLSCKKCSESHPGCLVFHHRNPNEKIVEVSVMAGHGMSEEKILAEIAKCDVYCANCHMKHHYDLKNGSDPKLA